VKRDAKKLATAGAAGLAAAAAGYVAWSRTGRKHAAPAGSRLEDFACYGEDRGCGNLLGVEPYMLPGDYASERFFHSRLETYLRAAHDRGWLKRDTVVVFPEYIGTWLVALGEKRTVFLAPSLTEATRALVSANLGPYLRAYTASPEPDRAVAAVFRMKARAMASAYDATFSSLARDHGVTIVAGSIVLPGPRVLAGRLHATDGPLYNVSATYGPDGRAYEALARKAYPVGEESGFLAAAPPEEAPVYPSPAGPVGVLVCADAWYPAPYEALRAKGASAVAVPSFGRHTGVWSAPWKGYSGNAPHPDFEADDVGRITEKEAWLKYALPARMAAAGADTGLNVFFRGRLWGMQSEAETIFVTSGETHVRPVGNDPPGALINVWR